MGAAARPIASAGNVGSIHGFARDSAVSAARRIATGRELARSGGRPDLRHCDVQAIEQVVERSARHAELVGQTYAPGRAHEIVERGQRVGGRAVLCSCGPGQLADRAS